MGASTARVRGLWLAAVAVVLLVAAGLQVLNYSKVHDAICGTGEGRRISCTAGPDLLAFQGEARDLGLPPALGSKALRLQASTALLRTGCDGRWRLAFGTRVDVDPLVLGDVLEAGRACVDLGPDSARGQLAGLQLRHAQCVVHVDPVAFDWDDALTLRLRARVAPEAAPACAALLPPSLGPNLTQQLVDGRISLDLRHGLSFAQAQAPATSVPARAPDNSAGGWLRRGLAEFPTSQVLRVQLPGGGVTLSFESSPLAQDAKGSPELTLSFEAEGVVLGLLPEALRALLANQRPLRLRWRLDHENGRVLVNDKPFPRRTAQPRTPGPTTLTADECGTALAGLSPTLYFVEAGDGGKAVDAEQSNAVLHAASAARTGALVSVFVHGWQHSAAPRDDYVCDYAKLIAAVEAMETFAARAASRPARKVMGVYVGWPGDLYGNELANATTFWNRLQVADRLGAKGALLHTLIQGLAERVATHAGDPRADRASALIITGHSMGGRAVFQAVRDGLAQPADIGAARPNLVLLVNPAFSAEQYRGIHALRQQCRAGGAPLLLFSSESDHVTRQVYPAGQAVTFEVGAPRAAPFLEHVYTAANFGEFVTHRLHLSRLRGDAPRPDGEQTILRGFQRVPAGSNELYRENPVTVYRQPASGRPQKDDAWYEMRLDRIDLQSAECPPSVARVIQVDARIIPDHGTIFTPPFMEYVVRTLNHSVLGAQH